ncbi:ABC transporter permease [bacterium]|nr:ABC transporter permease [bacterium]
MKYLIAILEFVGGVTILTGRVLRLLLRGRLNLNLLVQQMGQLGVNSIPISVIVLCFISAVFTYIIADDLAERGAAGLMGGLLLLVLLREFIPAFCGVVLAGKIGASITSEVGSMKITEQIDALKALSVDPDWYLTLPRVLGGMLMMPVIAVFAGYGGWLAGYYTAYKLTNMSYSMFESSVPSLVDHWDYLACAVKCIVFCAMIVLTACWMGYRTKGGAAGVGRQVTNGVVINIVLLFAMDLLLTMVLKQ